MDIDFITSAIQNYFRDERQEIVIFLIFSIGLVMLTIWLYLVAKDNFAQGFLVIIIGFASLLSLPSLLLLKRDPLHQQKILIEIKGRDVQRVLREEIQRINLIIGKYSYYRYLMILLTFLAIIAVLATRNSYFHGVAAGMLLLMPAQLIIDHYSERRALSYKEALFFGLKQNISNNYK